ncbi:hypothetical protein KTH33_15545, partial [Acinetobacter johnsonii]|uniref:hypothetical protein n=1 Tax=Acinetobacter johnsonii TaxID=40214 RepID=UPI0021CD5982
MKKLSFISLVTIAMLSGCQKDPELTKAENLISQFNCSVQDYSNSEDINEGEFKHEVRQFEKSYDNQQAEQISLM